MLHISFDCFLIVMQQRLHLLLLVMSPNTEVHYVLGAQLGCKKIKTQQKALLGQL